MHPWRSTSNSPSATSLRPARHSGGTHLGELWDLPPTGNRVELEFIDIFRVCDGRLIEHWTSMDISALRHQMRP